MGNASSFQDKKNKIRKMFLYTVGTWREKIIMRYIFGESDR